MKNKGPKCSIVTNIEYIENFAEQFGAIVQYPNLYKITKNKENR